MPSGEVSAAPNNPRIYLVQGEGAIFTPPEWGGGPDAAQKLLQRAAELFAPDHPAAPAPSWDTLNVRLAWAALERLGRKADALAAYRKAPELEPSYAWVSNLLIPSLQKTER